MTSVECQKYTCQGRIRLDFCISKVKVKSLFLKLGVRNTVSRYVESYPNWVRILCVAVLSLQISLQISVARKK